MAARSELFSVHGSRAVEMEVVRCGGEREGRLDRQALPVLSSRWGRLGHVPALPRRAQPLREFAVVAPPDWCATSLPRPARFVRGFKSAITKQINGMPEHMAHQYSSATILTMLHEYRDSPASGAEKRPLPTALASGSSGLGVKRGYANAPNDHTEEEQEIAWG
jgi:hypothetical protein